MMKRTMSKLFELPEEDDEGTSGVLSTNRGQQQAGKSSRGGIMEALSSVRDHRGVVTRDCCRKLLLIDKPSSPTSELIRRYGAGAAHFLKACFLCKKDIAAFDQDIYMYMCKTFCSTACRHQQMFTDERSLKKVATTTVV